MTNKSMSAKFIKMFVVIIVIPIFIISITLNRIYSNIMFKHYSERTQQYMEQLSVSFEDELRELSLKASTISHDKDLLGLITQWYFSSEELSKFKLSEEIDLKLNQIMNYSNNINSIVFFMKDRGAFSYKAPLMVSENNIRNSPWYIESLKNKGKVINLGTLENISNNPSRRNISLTISPHLFNNNYLIENIYFEFRTAIFDSIYHKFKSKFIGKLIVADEEGQILATSHKEFIGNNINDLKGLNHIDLSKGAYIKKIEGKKMFICPYKINKPKWFLVNIIDYDLVNEGIEKNLKIFIITFLIIIGLFILFTFQFFREIISPINKLIDKMKNVHKGNFDDKIEINSENKEVKELCITYNEMIDEIKKLIVQKDIKEKQRAEEEIKALQAQINPHFVYNTLNSIRFMAMISKVHSIKNITDSFMKLLSFTFKSNNKLITIKEEVQCLEHYINIMKVRYGDNFQVKLNIDDKIFQYYTIKFLLQPIIENSILHGLSEKEEEGTIEIKGYRVCESIYFEITDNGVGMTESEIYEYLNEEKINKRSFNQIGLVNVNKRLKLNFGEEYGIEIESKVNEYTTVRIILPIIINLGEEEFNE